MVELKNQTCIPCSGATPSLPYTEITELAKQLAGWQVVNNHHLTKNYSFTDFRSALEFVVGVSEIAEREGHHPDICFGWGHAELTIFTHAIDGLSTSDFVLAAKIDSELSD
jgi:4a-hydroxytetrahydrobiopterin dehydratase